MLLLLPCGNREHAKVFELFMAIGTAIKQLSTSTCRVHCTAHERSRNMLFKLLLLALVATVATDTIARFNYRIEGERSPPPPLPQSASPAHEECVVGQDGAECTTCKMQPCKCISGLCIRGSGTRSQPLLVLIVLCGAIQLVIL